MKKDLFNSKKDYVVLNGDKYIQSYILENIHNVGSLSVNNVTVHNREKDTIYVFGTVLTNTNMFYSKKNISIKGSNLVIDSYYENFIEDAIHSGIKRFNFIEILPDDSLVINIDRKKFEGENNFTKNGVFYYYYFLKEGNNFNGLVNISKNKIHKKEVRFSW